MEQQHRRALTHSGTTMSRRAFMKKGIQYGFGLLGALTIGGGAYITGLEPRWLEVVRTSLTLPRLPQAFRGVKVAHFSDIHYDFFFGQNRLESLMDRIMKEKPDLICFTGDLVDDTVGDRGEEISGALRRLEAPLGKFACLGNHDYYDSDKKVVAVLESGGFACLRNSAVRVRKGGESIRVAGVEDTHRGRPSLKRIYEDHGEGEFLLLLSHAPDYAFRALQYEVNLQLSGHSHGGQIRLPFIGAAKKVPGARILSQGLYDVMNDGRLVYVNRGAGVTGLPIRFMCRPELTIHTLG